NVEQALDYDRFAGWLRSYGSTAIGMPNDRTACPLAVYLRESAVSAADVFVLKRKLAWREHGRRRSVPLPLWALRFVEAVDRSTVPLMANEAANLLLPKEVLERDPRCSMPLRGSLRGSLKGREAEAISHGQLPGGFGNEWVLGRR